jgi:hypothetical protein
MELECGKNVAPDTYGPEKAIRPENVEKSVFG